MNRPPSDAATLRSGALRCRAILLGACLLCPVPALGSSEGEDGQAEARETLDPALELRHTQDAPAPAEDTEASRVERNEFVIQERVMVIGSPDKAFEMPGSAHYIGEAELEKHQYEDVHRVLRRVPGINIQEEDGYGLRPNIGMRGTGVERSQKITLLEDGVLIAPAPYSAPAAYYFPVTGRMQGLEVRKGSSSIKQGPYTNGGALNLLSRRIPSAFGGQLEVAAGDDGLRRAHAYAGDSRMRFGWVVETYQLESDGFKELDTGGSTGFDLEDYLVKFRVNSGPRARRYQSLELKLGKTEQFGKETYLGLTREDFDQDPYRRYAGSQEDFLTTDHESVVLTHFLQVTAGLDVATTIYHNDFFRNWHKLDSVNGIKISNVLGDPAQYASELAILRGGRGSEPGALRVRNNRRDYYSRGVQSVFGLRLESARVNHSLEFGVRYHEDQEDRFQEDDRFQMVDRDMVLTSFGTPGSDANRISKAEAMAVFLQDTISIGRWMLTPGMRLEDIDFSRIDYGDDDPGRTGAELSIRENEFRELIPGIGATYRVRPGLSLFGGLHKGFSPPGPGADQRTEPEESINYELGVRCGGQTLEAQVVAFFNDYDNLLGRDTLSKGGTGSGDLFNGGEVEISGLETSVSYDLSRDKSRSYSVPARLAYTYTSGEFKSSFETAFADWAPAVEAGDELPYLPEHQLFAEIGVALQKWSLFLNASYVGEMRTKAGRGTIPEEERIEDHLVFDLSLGYSFLTRYKASLQVRNLTDEVYVAARRPAGLRPGLPRSVAVGIAVRF